MGEGGAREADYLRTMAAAVAGTALAFLDLNGISILLPVLQAELDVRIGTLQWVVSAMTLFLASLILLAGSLGDRYGRRRIFTLGIGVFGAGALAASLAPGATWLIAARALQGIGAALLMPASLALIRSNVPEERRGRAFGWWAATTGLAGAIGPVGAGFLAQQVSWRAVFAAFVPLALVTFLLARRVRESRNPEAGEPDVKGALLATLGLGALSFGLIHANRTAIVNPVALASAAAGVALLVAFVIVEKRVPSPMMPPALFRNKTFSGVNLGTFAIYFAITAVFFFTPFMLVQVHERSPTFAGAATLPFALILAVLSPVAGRAMGRFGARGLMVGGSLVVALGLLAFARIGATGSYWTTFFPAFVLMGLGMAAVVSPLTSTVMSAAPGERAGIASGINNAVARTAGLLAVVVLGLVATQVFASALPESTQRLLGEEVKDLAEARVPEGVAEERARQVREQVESAFVTAWRTAMLTSAGLTLLGAGVLWWSVEREGHR